MAKIPFGRDLYGVEEPAVTSVPCPTAAAQQKKGSSTPLKDPREKNKRKETHDIAKHRHPKKGKNVVTEESPSDSVASTMGSLAAGFLTDKDIQDFKIRKEANVESNFITGLGDVFYQGYHLISKKNFQLAELEKLVNKLKSENTSVNAKLALSQKKLEDEVDARKKEVEKLTVLLEKEKTDAATARLSLEGEVEKLQGELMQKDEGIRAKLQKAYHDGLMEYLRTFMAADPDYGWEKFPSSVSSYMAKYKIEHAEDIAKAQEELRQALAAENKASLAHEAKNDDVAATKEADVASPSQTVAP